MNAYSERLVIALYEHFLPPFVAQRVIVSILIQNHYMCGAEIIDLSLSAYFIR